MVRAKIFLHVFLDLEIPDHDLREIFLQNSKTNHTAVKQKCLQVLDSDTQKQV